LFATGQLASTAVVYVRFVIDSTTGNPVGTVDSFYDSTAMSNGMIINAVYVSSKDMVRVIMND
jgi:hypothetical protein